MRFIFPQLYYNIKNVFEPESKEVAHDENLYIIKQREKCRLLRIEEIF